MRVYQLQGMSPCCSLVGVLQKLPVQATPLQVRPCGYRVGVTLHGSKDLTVSCLPARPHWLKLCKRLRKMARVVVFGYLCLQSKLPLAVPQIKQLTERRTRDMQINIPSQLVGQHTARRSCSHTRLTSGVASFIGVAPGSSDPAGEMKGGVMMAGVRPGIPPCMRTAYPSDRACKTIHTQLCLAVARPIWQQLATHSFVKHQSIVTGLLPINVLGNGPQGRPARGKHAKPNSISACI